MTNRADLSPDRHLLSCNLHLMLSSAVEGSAAVESVDEKTPVASSAYAGVYTTFAVELVSGVQPVFLVQPPAAEEKTHAADSDAAVIID